LNSSANDRRRLLFQYRAAAARPDLLRYDELIMAGATALEPRDER
jgi:hypothetical protein